MPTDQLQNITMSKHPIYNVTYTLHRLPPLHKFPSPPEFKTHARYLQQLLRGDVLRGVRIADDEALGRAGRLKGVTWKPLPPWRGPREVPEGEEEGVEDEGEILGTGVQIEISYENTAYTSLLLSNSSSSPTSHHSHSEFTRLPLLLTRMPKALRETLLSYIATSFDALPSPLPLPSQLLLDSLDTYLSRASVRATKDVQITFGTPVSTLRSITITIPRDDVEEFCRSGGRFYDALRKYAVGVMGLDVAALTVAKVACGGFVLGAGRVKVFPPEDGGGGNIVRGLVEASGMGM